MALTKSVTRLLTGLVFGFTALFAIMAGGLWLEGLVLIIVALASKEYVKILEHKGFYPSLKIILLAEALLALITYFDRVEYVA